MRKLIGILGLVSVVAALVVPIASARDNSGQYRGRYQLRLNEARALLTPPPATREP
jgi:hypothetical protein